MNVMRCVYFYINGRILNIHIILQGVLAIHIEKFKILIVFDIIILATNTYHKKIHSITERLLCRDYRHLILCEGKLLGAYGLFSFRRMEKKLSIHAAKHYIIPNNLFLSNIIA